MYVFVYIIIVKYAVNISNIGAMRECTHMYVCVCVYHLILVLSVSVSVCLCGVCVLAFKYLELT